MDEYATYCPDCDAMFCEGEEGYEWEQCFECGGTDCFEIEAS